MDLKALKKMAAVSVIALGVASYSTSGIAQVTIDSGDVVPMDVTATILNTIDIGATALDFGTIAVIPKAGDQATAVVAVNNAFTGTTVGAGFDSVDDARIVRDTASTPLAAVVTVEAFPTTELDFAYGNVIDLTLDGLGVGPALEIIALADNLGNPTGLPGGVGGGGASANGGWTVGAGSTDGIGRTNADGDLVFRIGGTIETPADATPFPDGTYQGSFDLTVSY
jgi:hypothetical protein